MGAPALFQNWEDRVAKYIMAVYSNAMPGRDADYMEWYKNVHMGEICTLPGVKGGHVFEAIPASPVQPIATYLAIYDLEVDDPTSVVAAMGKMGAEGRMTMSDAIDVSSAKITLMKQNF